MHENVCAAEAVHLDFILSLRTSRSLSSVQVTQTNRTMQRLLDAPELLDEVLSYLAASDLLRVRAVCKNLQDAVTFSPRSAVKLFHADQFGLAPRPSPCMRNLCSVAGISHQDSTPHIASIISSTRLSLHAYELIRSSPFLGKMLLGQPAPHRIRIFLCSCTPWRSPLSSLDAWSGALLMEDLCELVVDCASSDPQAPAGLPWCSRCRRGFLQVNAYWD